MAAPFYNPSKKMPRKKAVEPVVEIPEPVVDVCFGCYHRRIDGQCEYEKDCALLEADLNKDSEEEV